MAADSTIVNQGVRRGVSPLMSWGNKCGAALCGLTLVLITAGLAGAQTVDEPRTLQFQPSEDHNSVLVDGRPAVTSYVIEIYSAGAFLPAYAIDLGKPAPGADGLIRYDVTATIGNWPVTTGLYEARVVAIGPFGAARSIVSNPFRVARATTSQPGPTAPTGPSSQTCTFTVSTTSVQVGSRGAAPTVSVAAPAGCVWTATTTSKWMSLQPEGGIGAGVVSLVVPANSNRTTRAATATIAGKVVSVAQDARATASLEPAHTVTITSAPRGTPNPSSGQAVALSATAVDSLGHVVHYHWESACSGGAAGTFAPSDAIASPTWMPPQAPAGKELVCVLSLTVTDNVGTTVQASYSHSVNGPAVAHTITFVQPASTTSSVVASGGTTALNGLATDSLGHALSYQWTATCPGLGGGLFGVSAGTAAASWTAPANETGADVTCTLDLVARDPSGTTASSSVSQRVSAVARPHALTFTSAPAASPNPATAGANVTLTALATDSLGHPISYQWSVSCNGGIGGGTLASTAGAGATWTTPMVSAGEIQTCSVTVTASDGQGLTQSRSFTQVLSRPTRHTLTINEQPKGMPNVAPDGQPIAISVVAVDSFLHPLQYLWQASCDAASGAGTWLPSATVATPTWRPPVNRTRGEMSCLVRVSVIDDRGTFVQGSYVQRVAAPAVNAEPTSTPPPADPPPVPTSSEQTSSPTAPPIVAPPSTGPATASNETPAFSRYLAEGAIGAFFRTRLALLNVSTEPARATLRFQRTDGTEVTASVAVGARSRITVDPALVEGMTSGEFATRVDSDRELVVERTVSWGATGAGSHSEVAVAAPSTQWHFAEGTTVPGHDLFLLLSNPGTTADAEVRVRYLFPRALPVEQTYIVPRQSRHTVWVNKAPAAGVSALDSTDMAMAIEVANGVPIVAEQALYVSPNSDRPFSGGVASAGITAPASTWYFADGSTASGAETLLLLANPDLERPAVVRVTYRRPDGRTFSRLVTVAASHRDSVPVSFETFEEEYPMGNLASFTMKVESTNGVPIVAERSTWWPTGERRGLAEGHRSAGATSGGFVWASAEGEVGGPAQADTHVIVLNPSATASGRARVTVLPETGAPLETTVVVPASGRVDVNVGSVFPQLAGRFGVLVESVGTAPVPLVVERSTYTNAVSAKSGGTSVLATRMR
ncbi:MAG: hypothetical protein AB7I50_13685 [Vicinamibacterales bacterium]